MPVLYFCAFEFLLAWLVANPYILNRHYTFHDCLSALGYVFRSVLFEELIFRGALFYVLWKKIGPRLTIFIAAFSFGVYHWFAWQAFGNPAQMVIILLTTSAVGLIYGYAFVRSGSMFLPIALHLGSNIATMILFSKDHTLGPELLVKAFTNDPVEPPAFISVPMVILHFVGYQCFIFLAVRWYCRDSAK